MPVASQERFPIGLLCALGAAEMVTSFEISMLYVAMPKIVRQYGDPILAFWVISIYYLVATSSVTLSSRLGDLFGRKRVLLAMLGISICGSLTSALSTSFTGLLLGRALTGASAATMPLCFGLIRQHFPKSRMSQGIAIAAAIPAILGGLGTLLGGVFIDHFPWRLIFVLSSSLALFSVCSVAFAVPADQRSRFSMKIDWLGGLLTIPSFAGLLGTVNLARSWGWNHSLTLSILAASITLLAIWIVYELRQGEPLVDVRLFGRRQIALTNAAMAFLAIGALQAGPVISLRLQQPEWTSSGFGASATLTGALFLPLHLAALIAGLWCGRMVVAHGSRYAALMGAGICASGWALAALYHSHLIIFMGLVYLAIFGFNVMYCAIPNLIIEAAPPDRTSEATGVTTVVRLLATGVGAQIVALTLGWEPIPDPLHQGGHFTSDLSFTIVYVAFSAATVIAGMLIRAILPGASRAARYSHSA